MVVFLGLNELDLRLKEEKEDAPRTLYIYMAYFVAKSYSIFMESQLVKIYIYIYIFSKKLLFDLPFLRITLTYEDTATLVS